jgi:hypothetical protein
MMTSREPLCFNRELRDRIQKNPADFEFRTHTHESTRKAAPIIETIPGINNPVLRMPVGSSAIAAPTAALIYQFREVAIMGRDTRVAHFEQPQFAWG